MGNCLVVFFSGTTSGKLILLSPVLLKLYFFYSFLPGVTWSDKKLIHMAFI